MTPASSPSLSIGAVCIYQGERAHTNLEYAVILDVVPRRGKPEVAAAVRAFLIESGFQADKPVREALGTIMANLWAAWATQGNPFLVMPMRSTDYAHGSRLRKLWLKYKPTTTAVHALHRAGFIELHRGIHFGAFRRRTRIRATDKLVSLFIRHRINHDSVELQDRGLVILRGPKLNGEPGKPINISRGIHAATARPFKENVRRINEALSAANIELHITEKEYIENFINRLNGKKTLIPPHPLRNQLCRVFNETFDYGGRFYRHWVQSVPRELRRFIRINGEPVMELDFKAIHPTLLYAERGLMIEGEVYVPPGWPHEFRKVFKLLMLAAINADDRAKAIKAVRKDIHDRPDMLASFHECLTDRWLIPAFEALVERHKPISAAFFTGAGLRLQRKDSEIAEHVILTLLDGGVVPVPIHDSFLVALSHSDALREAMLSASKDIAGVAIPVKEKWPIHEQIALQNWHVAVLCAPVMDRGGIQEDFRGGPGLSWKVGQCGGLTHDPNRPHAQWGTSGRLRNLNLCRGMQMV